MPHTDEDVDDLFFLYRQVASNTALSIDARAGYLTAVVRMDRQISNSLDYQSDETLVALFRERLVAEDSQRAISRPAAEKSS
ncbi:hypothetical protein [Myxococcus virescens]|uniref:Uncharacterized protein n=1 Tax=Myxococcus virescens TaxID=83456 RepID=A0A511HQ88_9BACT|nr:hypothetical protein [Myxococcus virescens]GEL75756.1 hypothetical protein MVI01_75400 [Myxococcus virescens]SDF27654.1 hypothetical protein SAMN04488504_12754 [Myxococcus virescens]